MENIKNKLIELGNYLISVCDKSKEQYYYNIKGKLIDLPEFFNSSSIKFIKRRR